MASNLTNKAVYDAVKGMLADGFYEAQSRRSKEQIEGGLDYTTMFTKADAKLEADFLLTPDDTFSFAKVRALLAFAKKFIEQNKLNSLAPITYDKLKVFSGNVVKTAKAMLQADAEIKALPSSDKALLMQIARGAYKPKPPYNIPSWAYWVGGGLAVLFVVSQGRRFAGLHLEEK